MSNHDGMSEEFELLDVSHDVLSMSDAETSDGYENDLRTAAAIIEALEDAPHGSLQVSSPTRVSAVAGIRLTLVRDCVLLARVGL